MKNKIIKAVSFCMVYGVFGLMGIMIFTGLLNHVMPAGRRCAEMGGDYDMLNFGHYCTRTVIIDLPGGLTRRTSAD
jgi:hypothetical protein